MKQPTQPARCERCRDAGGFSLLEVLLVVALVGLLSTVLIVGGGRLAADRPATAEEAFWQAVQHARDTALLGQEEVSLAYDRETGGFVVAGVGGARSFPVPEGDWQIDLLSAQRIGGTVLVGGVLVETQPLQAVAFFRDGTCTPFRVQLRDGAQAAQVLAVDPWTCAPVLTGEPAS